MENGIGTSFTNSNLDASHMAISLVILLFQGRPMILVLYDIFHMLLSGLIMMTILN